MRAVLDARLMGRRGFGMRAQELLYVGVGVADSRGRQTSQKHLSVAAPPDARVEDGDDAPISRAADQAAKTLFERQRGSGHQVAHERGLTRLFDARTARCNDRIAWNLEGKLVDDDHAEGGTGDIDALPEAGGRKEHRAAMIAKTVEQGLLGRISLNEPFPIERLADALREGSHHAKRRAQDEDPSVGETNQRADLFDRDVEVIG